jgi:hypothetical protein
MEYRSDGNTVREYFQCALDLSFRPLGEILPWVASWRTIPDIGSE